MESATDPDPITVTITEATILSRLSRSTLYRLAGSGIIPFVKSGARTLVPLQALKHYLTSLPSANIRPSVH